jgi:hypothetical protein
VKGHFDFLIRNTIRNSFPKYPESCIYQIFAPKESWQDKGSFLWLKAFLRGRFGFIVGPFIQKKTNSSTLHDPSWRDRNEI